MNKLNHHRSRGLVLHLAFCLLMLFAVSNATATATITIVNNDGAGEGFNDATPRAPVGGNPGTTLGDQRLFVFNYGASIWGNILTSPVTILVRAQFNPQTCTSTSATLGSTGATTTHRNFAGAPVANTWYVQSLANRLAGTDLSTANPDMNSTFNSNIDNGCFGPGLVWYYGVDGLEGSNIELLPVVLHETAHGLGFMTTTNGSTGAYNSSSPSIYDYFLMDNTLGLHWTEMTQAQRAASSIAGNHLVWDGARGKHEGLEYLGPKPTLRVNTPGAIAGDYEIQTASFGPALTLGGTTGDVVLGEDNIAPINDVCDTLTNAGALAGKIALVDRGVCTFVIKAQKVQAAGAIGMIVVNNVAAGLPGMGGTDATITIPCIGISQADGNAIKAQLGAGVNVSMMLNPARKAGMDTASRVLMYSPNPYASGSSVSHWDTSLSPDALMEPNITASEHDIVDMTHGLLADIGWFPEIVPVTLEEFTAEGSPDGILVRWRFADLSDVGTITLERSSTVEGPWSPLQTELGQDGPTTTALDTSAQPGETYFYHLKITDRRGQPAVLGSATAQRLTESLRLSLSAPSPNPAVGGTSVSYRIGSADHVKLTITDVSGRVVRTLENGAMIAGQHMTQWDGRNDRGDQVSAGVYFIRLSTNHGVKTQRVTIVR
jgi:hypothetical protein